MVGVADGADVACCPASMSVTESPTSAQSPASAASSLMARSIRCWLGLSSAGIGAGAGDDEVDAVVQAVELEVSADSPVGIIADHGDGATGVTATDDDVVHVGGRECQKFCVRR